MLCFVLIRRTCTPSISFIALAVCYAAAIRTLSGLVNVAAAAATAVLF